MIFDYVTEIIAAYFRKDLESSKGIKGIFKKFAFGSKGKYIFMIQDKLRKKGFDCGIADGVFGNRTLQAVRQFQKLNGVEADGIVGPLTWVNLV